ncbi:glutamate formimidoyltransferase [Geothrix sp. 21YS21S-2]|uniref:glutamate formimidoyltransferase n=1 Tax=Geothrix sp. 21YS21S-2 TaxID=3068893 RepID=UPI0027B8AC4F|nr:glutamate formimidoyltransferase [Geothrix sp. 21YS21S-2]
MAHQVVECVPNFSEGRDLAKIRQITDAIEAVAGVRLLDVDPGADTNRTVVTFVGSPEAVVEAAFQAVSTAARVLDMASHAGAHPRMGATDVCPFVPVEGVTLADCAALARTLGERVGRELELPVYLYEHAASRPERRNLAVVRKGEYEGLEEKLKDPQWAPDFGPARFDARAGALITGAREFLVAYNVTLNSRDKNHATDIAFELREKGRVARRGQKDAYYSSGEILFYREGCFPCGNCGSDFASFEEVEAHCRAEHGFDLRHLLKLNDIDAGKGVVGRKVHRAGLFRHCKAIGWYVDQYKRAQLSINLTDYKVTSPVDVLEATRRMAVERGLVVTGSEIVGLVPFQALYKAGQHYLRVQGKSPFVPVGDVLENAVFSMGLADVSPFDVEKKVIGLPRAYPKGLMAMTGSAFVDEVSRDTPAPGGGSIAALAGALGAALASMVANLTQTGAPELREAAEKAQKAKDALVLAVDEDTDAFTAYMEARRLPAGTPAEKAAREQAMQDGLKLAVDVPLGTARTCLEAMEAAELAMRHGNPASITDTMVGFTIAFAGVRGGLWNVLINLKDIKDAAYNEAMKATCASLLAQAQDLLARATAYGDARLEAMLVR